MDPILSKLIVSREKSIAVLESDIERMDALVKSTKVASVAQSLLNVVNLKRTRLVKLREELVGFRAAANAQLEIPAVDPTIRKK